MWHAPFVHTERLPAALIAALSVCLGFGREVCTLQSLYSLCCDHERFRQWRVWSDERRLLVLEAE
jgi:hypothetical protein